MKVYAVSDLHLSGAAPKAMDIFGAHWKNHFDKISEAWRQMVAPEDVVLIAGDISWAMNLHDAAVDLAAIGALPGRKVLIKGNHDYWWSSISRIRGMLSCGMHVLQNDAVDFGCVTIAGTRGWLCPNEVSYSPEDEKIYRRELIRMEMSLAQAEKSGHPIIAMIHYPPFNETRSPSGFTELFQRFGVRQVVYGHLHGPSIKSAFDGELEGVRYALTSCDAVQFKPRLIASFAAEETPVPGAK
nr:metallophosphoesterase [Maliibacterium massiliense]